MVSKISGNDDTMQLLMAQLYSKMNAADTDGTSGLSKNELSSVDAGDDVGGSAFLKSLTDQFDELDTDKDGQLSSSEISKAKPQEPMGPPPGMNLDDSDDSSTSFIDSLLKAYTQDNDSNGDGSISAAELVSKNSNGIKSESISDFISDNFDNYDTNSDGALSKDELKTAMHDAIKSSAKSENSGDSEMNSGETFKNMAASFVQKLLDSYKDGSLSSLTSELSTSVWFLF